MGDFQGHPFRGNQWTDTHASESAAGVSRGDYLAPTPVETYRSKQFQDDRKLLNQIHMAYAKNPLAPWSDEFSGGTGDAYRPENDLSTQLQELHSRQDAKLRELGIVFAYDVGGGYTDPRKGFGSGMPPDQQGATVTHMPNTRDWEVRDEKGVLVGAYGLQERANEVAAGLAPRHPIFETEDSPANALAATVLTAQIIAAIEEAPPEVRALLKDQPLNIRYEAKAPSFIRNGDEYTESASVQFTRIHDVGGSTKATLTLNVYRATSVTPDTIAHEVGHLFVYGVGRGDDMSAKQAIRVDMSAAVVAEGGITSYADSYQNGINADKGKFTDPFGVQHKAHEQMAEVESIYARMNEKNREAGRPDYDEVSLAHMMAIGKQGTVARIRGINEVKAFPKTALAWLMARNAKIPAPKDIRTWTEKDYRKAWEFGRVITLANGQTDPGGFGDGKAATQALRNRWKQQWEGR